MKRITAILILTFVCLFNTLYSQTKTPYEKKKEEIFIKYLKKMGVSTSEINRAKSADESGMLLLLLVGEKVQQYQYDHPMESLVLISEWEKETKAAEKLKGEADFQKEREKKEKEANEKIARQEKYEQEKLLEEQKREEQRLAQEKKEEEEYQKALIQFSDLQIIKNQIESQFKVWATKGEFETNIDYENRLNNKKTVLDSIAYRLVSGQVATLFGQYSGYNGEYSIILKEYDVDKQQYPIVLLGEFERDRLGNVKLSMEDTLLVETEIAKKIKKLAWKDDYTNQYVISTFHNSDVKLSKNLSDWIISQRGYFFPKSYTFFEKYTHTRKISSTSANNITFKTNDLGLSSYFPENYSIEIDKSWIKEREIERDILIKKAEKLFSENKFEQSKKLFNDANFLRYSQDVQLKILDIEDKLIEIKQNEIIKTADQLEKSGKISNSIEKLEEANKLKNRSDLSTKIDALKKDRDLALNNHKILDSLFTLAQTEKLEIFKDIVTPSALDEVKKGYGQKFLDCKSVISTKINSLWTVVSNSNTENNRNRNREVWNDKTQELMQKIIEFRNELSKNSNFEISVQKALMEKDKKFLKIFKEEDVNSIIETILKTN